jgi:mono/diheme cytochrome c family protein
MNRIALATASVYDPLESVKASFVSFLLGIALTLVGGFLFLTRGGMPVKTEGGPLPFERLISHLALHHAIGDEADKPSPLPGDTPNLVAGAHVYREQCAVCHGEWGRPPSATAKGMFPMPPQLLPPKTGVTDDPVGETFWKVRNGIRLTGMPGYASSLSDTEMWQVSLLLLHANELPAPAQDVLRR